MEGCLIGIRGVRGSLSLSRGKDVHYRAKTEEGKKCSASTNEDVGCASSFVKETLAEKNAHGRTSSTTLGGKERIYFFREERLRSAGGREGGESEEGRGGGCDRRQLRMEGGKRINHCIFRKEGGLVWEGKGRLSQNRGRIISFISSKEVSNDHGGQGFSLLRKR